MEDTFYESYLREYGKGQRCLQLKLTVPIIRNLYIDCDSCPRTVTTVHLFMSQLPEGIWRSGNKLTSVLSSCTEDNVT